MMNRRASFVLTAICLMAAVLRSSAGERPYGSVRADVSALPEEMRFVGELLTTRVIERIGGRNGATLTVRYVIDPALADEEASVCVADGAATVRAARLRGLVFGTGRLLKALRYAPDSFAVTDGAYGFRPAKPVRIAYLARHFINPYMQFDAARLTRYMDDLVLDGINGFQFQITMPAVDVARTDDAEKAAFLACSREMIARVRRLDCGLWGGGGGNQLPMDSDESLRAEPHRNPRAPATGFNACPAKAEAFAEMLEGRRRYFDAVGDVTFDTLVNWPYDEGGCGCTNCYPWGCNGYLAMCKRFHDYNRTRQPLAKACLSTWFFTDEEYAGLWKYIEKNDWIDSLIIDDFGTEFPRYPLENPPPKKVKVITFPEISMWGRAPWGAYGAIAYPKMLERIFRSCAHIATGFKYYSEGIFEDINKAVVTDLYVDPTTTADAALARYAAYHFAGCDPADFVKLANLLEGNHRPTFLTRENVDAAVRLADRIESGMLPSLRTSWRWRLVWLRTRIDAEIERAGCLTPKRANRYFDELIRLYCAERQLDWWLEGRMGGWTCPNYIPDGRSFKTHRPPSGDATEILRKLVDDPAFITVRLGRGTWKIGGDVRLARSRFELVLEDGCRLETDGDGRLVIGEGVDGVTVRGEGSAHVLLPVAIVKAKNVVVRGIVAPQESVTISKSENVRIDLSAEPDPLPDGLEGLRRLDKTIEWFDQHLEREKVERLLDRLKRMKDETGWSAAPVSSAESVCNR